MQKDENTATKVLVLGGCHVEGFKVGAFLSFVSVFGNKLKSSGLNTDISFKSYIIAKKIEQIIELLDAHQPRFLVLQMGNYEFLNLSSYSDLDSDIAKYKTSLSKLAIFLLDRKSLKQKRKSSLNSSSSHKSKNTQVVSQAIEIIDPYSVWKPINRTLVNRVKEFVRVIISRFDGYQRLDQGKIYHLYDTLFNILSQRGLKVVVMGPLPIFDHIIHRYRVNGGKMFQELATKYGFAYFDSCKPLASELWYLPKKDYFIDPIHLNAKGHRIIGNDLAETFIAYAKSLEHPAF